jgi:4-hydroxyphenylpyruvate dioxygenase-like putative hemolysin
VNRAIVTALLVTAAACGTARNAEVYRDDTQHLLATHKTSVKRCYDTALAADQSAAGVVAIAFTVENSTGAITDAKLDRQRTTAPHELGKCVLEAVRGLQLDPPDRHDGHATFVYEFHPPAAT